MTQDDKAVQKALGRALNLISYRQRTETELRRRLSEKAVPDVVDVAVEQLKERGLIDDAKYAREWSDSRSRRSPRSSRMIVRELVNKGVSPHLAELSVEELDDDDTAHDAASRFAMRLADADYEQFHRRLWGHLQRRGYGAGVSRRVISRLWQQRQKDLRQ
ncbi:MAG: RecX family transcriptional regulator [Dehalococcoidia bacterium]|nr:RecX family transcriptional regulator [Dehalococcoidia bacterium]